MKSRTFRFDESDIELLKQLSEEMGCTQAEAIRWAIRNATQKQAEENAAEAAVLVEQLRVKDEQIKTLQRLLDQEQQLHMTTARKVALLEEPKRGFWSRLFGDD